MAIKGKTESWQPLVGFGLSCLLLVLTGCGSSKPTCQPAPLVHAPLEHVTIPLRFPTMATLGPEELAVVRQACGKVAAARGSGFSVLSTAVGDTASLTLEATKGRGRVQDMDMRYQSNGNTVTLTTAKSRGAYAVSESSISQSDFSMKTKSSYLAEIVSLAYGIGLLETSTQRLLPNEAIGPGSSWQHVITHEFGGTVTVFHLESIDGLGQATIEFERFVCLRNVPHYASPDYEPEPCRNDTVEMRVEKGKLTMRPGLPLPNARASMIKRVTVQPIGKECGEDVVIDMRGEIALVWVAEQSPE